MSFLRADNVWKSFFAGAALACSVTGLFIVLSCGLFWPATDNSNFSVVIIRHGDAPGRDEPPNFDLADCGTQRNLSDEGRSDARERGEALRREGIRITKILSSRWCRTRETAELLHVGTVKDEPIFDNLDINKAHAEELLNDERELIANWRGPGVLLIVTHSSNIRGLTGLDVEPGVMIIATRTPEGGIAFRFSKLMAKDMFS